MSASAIASVFSRKFIVGFFIPVFFGSFALKLLVDERALPSALRDEKGAAQLAILVGMTLLLALLLWGLHYPLLRLLEGYWLIARTVPARRPRTRPRHGRLDQTRLAHLYRTVRCRVAAGCNSTRRAVGHRYQTGWVQTRAQLLEIKAHPQASPERTEAAMELALRYPPEERLVLPTELGNVIRAFETHPRERYGLDGIAAWPRLAPMLSDSERASMEDATTDLAFWLNSLTVITVAGSLLFVERLWHRPSGILATICVEVGIIVLVVAATQASYRQTISSAIRWGHGVRAAFDTHILELYDCLGVRRPVSPEEDREVGRIVGRLFAFAEPVPTGWRTRPEPVDESVPCAGSHEA